MNFYQIKEFLKSFIVYVCLHVFMCTMCVQAGVWRDQKRALDPLDPQEWKLRCELLSMVLGIKPGFSQDW